MKHYRFFCNGHNAPAYSCDTSGDNSGVYYKKEDVDKLLLCKSREEKIKMNKHDPEWITATK